MADDSGFSFKNLFQVASGALKANDPTGTTDRRTGAMYTRPWNTVTAEGLWRGNDNSVWLYMAVGGRPLVYEDPAEIRAEGDRIYRILRSIGTTSRTPPYGMKTLADNRQIHLLSISWQEPTPAPPHSPPLLRDFQSHILDFESPHRVTLLGVQLRSGSGSNRSDGTLTSTLRATALWAAGQEETAWGLFEADHRFMSSLLREHGCRPPTDEEVRWAQGWHNRGGHPDVTMRRRKDHLLVENPTLRGQFTTIEMLAVSSFNRVTGWDKSTHSWLGHALHYRDQSSGRPAGPMVVSIRAELQTGAVTRRETRKVRKWARGQREEQSKVSKFGDDDLDETEAYAAEVEARYASDPEPSLWNTSIIFGRLSDAAVDSSFADMLESYYEIETKPLEHRQIAAWAETLPTSTVRVSPFPQFLDLEMLSHSGITSTSDLGDPIPTEPGSSGGAPIFVGRTLPDGNPCWYNPSRFSAAHRSPATLIVGEPGSGKAQPLDALILTPNGWVTMGSLAVGDTIVGGDGAPTAVVGVYPQGDRKIFRVTFDDGATAECDGDHLWAVTSGDGTQKVLTLNELTAADGGIDQWAFPTLSGPAASLGSGTQDAISLVRATAGSHNGHAFSSTAATEVVAVARALGWWATTHPADEGTVTIETYPPGARPRRLVSVEPVGAKAAQCIKVAAADQLYVTNDYVVTHNTFLLQVVTFQAALAGQLVFVLNPKPSDRLEGYVNLLNQMGGHATRLSLSDIANARGAYDPFRFAESPEMAAEILADHILSTLIEFDQAQRTMLKARLKRAALGGARCAWEAMSAVDDQAMVQVIRDEWEGSDLFALGMAEQPGQKLGAAKGLVVIDFDREIGLPENYRAKLSDYSDAEREALQAVRLIQRACIETLYQSGGGGFAMDEAWTLLSSPELVGRAQKIARMGRSQNIWMMLATQLLADVLNNDLETFISRLFVMRMRDAREAEAGLRLMNLEPTAERIEALFQMGPGEDGSPALAFHRDLNDRRAAVQIGPFPEWWIDAVGTSPEQKTARGEAQGVTREVIGDDDIEVAAAALRVAPLLPSTPTAAAPPKAAPPPAPPAPTGSA